MDILLVEVQSLIESHMVSTPSVIPPVVKLSPRHMPKMFYFFIEDDKEVPLVRAKKGHIRVLQDPNMPYD